MRDQADELRQLVLRGGCGSSSAPRSGIWERPRLVAVCGGQAGVGTTTVALNVSIALVRAGRRAVYVDAGERSAFAKDWAGANIGEGSQDSCSLAHVLAGLCPLHESLLN